MYDDVTKNDSGYWHFIVFAITFTLVEYFVFLNLFMAVLVDNFQSQLKREERSAPLDTDMDEPDEEQRTEEREEQNEAVSEGTAWPEGRSISIDGPHLEDLGHLPMDKRLLYVQFYNILCSLDYHAYVQKQNFLMMHKLVDKCQDPRLLLNSHAEKD